MTKNKLLCASMIIGLFSANNLAAQSVDTKIATFAGGCFWCVEKDFEHVNGVISAVSGYTGGMLVNPTYRSHGRHIEAVRITFDPKIVTYNQLLDVFWRSVNPTDGGGQFCDRGNSYKTAIFANSEEQRIMAEKSKSEIDATGILKAPIVTPIRNASVWTDAEGYHQDYYKKNPLRYKFYRYNCGRDATIQKLWGAQAHAGIDHTS